MQQIGSTHHAHECLCCAEYDVHEANSWACDRAIYIDFEAFLVQIMAESQAGVKPRCQQVSHQFYASAISCQLRKNFCGRLMLSLHKCIYSAKQCKSCAHARALMKLVMAKSGVQQAHSRSGSRPLSQLGPRFHQQLICAVSPYFSFLYFFRMWFQLARCNSLSLSTEVESMLCRALQLEQVKDDNEELRAQVWHDLNGHNFVVSICVC